MSSKQIALYPCSPNTVRGTSTKLSASKDKVIYANGKTVIIRDLKNTALSTTFSGHAYNTTVARFSPSGFYCASADTTGTVKIWDTIGEDQSVKWEYKVLSGKVNDLAWDSESKRIVAVGDGREKFGHAFLVDSGSSSGQINGHSKVINAVSIRHQRPFRAATASDDNAIIFHQGVPFKYDKTIRTHTKYVQDVQFGPSGDHFASVGSDSKIFLYDGKTGETVAELTDSPHKGTIMSCSWSPDSKSFFTTSLDCTVRLWDIETRKSLQAWTVGTGVPNQQVGGVWSGSSDLVSLSMSGDLNVFDPRTVEGPTRILQAPQKAITAASLTSSSTFLAGSADGRVLSYDTDTTSPSDAVRLVGGTLHTSLVSGMATASSGKVFTTGYDDHIREIDGSAYTPASTPLLSQPKSVAVTSDETFFVAGISSVEAIRNNQRVFELKPSFAPSAVGAGGNVVAVGGEDKRVHVHTWNGNTLTEERVLPESEGTITALSVSSDGALIVQGNASSAGKIALYNSQTGERIPTRWDWHTARISSLAFLQALSSPPTHVVSGSLDTNVYIWSLENTSKRVFIKGASSGGVNCVLWLGEARVTDGKQTGRVLSAGTDACARVWEVELLGK
ncbi:WD40 repeat-like protein [Rhizopogon vinicolor AM-OR11-026]|uniref:WD40 repeat-like protein n=1 Tax=Rhizopogon vinicolor AM-OR11-026 TaxID=1314800 RepID=A0A1B7MR42_9AGAM|nr:WD40 repeat-like protein [Rhizopogon vinicolor AM-OR11-026]